MKNNAKQKSKTNENVRIYVNFTKKEKEALKEYTLWQYERWEKTKEALGGNVRDLVLIGFLGFNAAFPIFAQLTITYKEVNGEKIEVEKLQGLESTLEEMAKFLKPNYRLDRLYRTAINMVDYVSTKWGFLRIGSQKTTSKKRRTDIMNQIREYFLNSAGCYPALKWSDGGYLVLGKQNPEKNAMCYINKILQNREKLLTYSQIHYIIYKHKLSVEAECGYILRFRKDGGNFGGVCYGKDQAVS